MRNCNTRRRLEILVIVVAALCCVVGTAHAQTHQKTINLAIIDVDGNTSRDSTDIHYFVEKGIRLYGGNRVQLLPTDLVLNAGENETDLQNIALGRDSMDKGLEAFAADNCEDAVDLLGQAATYFEQSHAFLDSIQEYLDTLVKQGICLDRMGNRRAAIRLFQAALVINPKLRLDDESDPPRSWEKARDKVLDKKLFSISVGKAQAHSRVMVDGRYRGVTPAFRPHLRRGTHFVKVERQGYVRQGYRINAPRRMRKKTVHKAVTLQETRKHRNLLQLLPMIREEFERGNAQAGPVTLRLSNLLLVDYIALFRATGPSKNKTLTVALYNLTTGQELNRKQIPLNWATRSKVARASVSELIRSLLDVPFETYVAPIEPVKPPEEPGGSIFKTWWFWTAVGVATLGGIVGLAVGLAPEEESTGLTEDGNGSVLLRF